MISRDRDDEVRTRGGPDHLILRRDGETTGRQPDDGWSTSLPAGRQSFWPDFVVPGPGEPTGAFGDVRVDPSPTDLYRWPKTPQTPAKRPVVGHPIQGIFLRRP